jgi:hypothetical protein
LKAMLSSAAAIGSGFAVTAILSIATDAAMHGLKVFPQSPETMSGSLFALASGYRALFTVCGGFVTARLAPSRPLRHAGILAGLGLLAGLAGVFAYYAIVSAALGPAWYALSIPAEAIPCVMLGGWLAVRRSISDPTT